MVPSCVQQIFKLLSNGKSSTKASAGKYKKYVRYFYGGESFVFVTVSVM